MSLLIRKLRAFVFSSGRASSLGMGIGGLFHGFILSQLGFNGRCVGESLAWLAPGWTVMTGIASNTPKSSVLGMFIAVAVCSLLSSSFPGMLLLQVCSR